MGREEKWKGSEAVSQKQLLNPAPGKCIRVLGCMCCWRASLAAGPRPAWLGSTRSSGRPWLGGSRRPYQVPEAQLSLTHLAEACGEDLAIGHEDGTDGAGAVVWLLFLLRRPLAG